MMRREPVRLIPADTNRAVCFMYVSECVNIKRGGVSAVEMVDGVGSTKGQVSGQYYCALIEPQK